jgi:hypothetical protein
MRNRPTSPLLAYRSLEVTFVKPRLEHIEALDSGRCRRALTAAVGATFSSSARQNWGHFKTEAFGEELLRAELHWTRKRRPKGEILIISPLRCTYQARILASTWPTGKNAGLSMECANVLHTLHDWSTALHSHRRFNPLRAQSFLPQAKGQGSRLPCSSFVCALKPLQ